MLTVRRLRAGPGFTLIELVVVIAIAAILAAAAVPNFKEWITNSRVRTTAESIQNGIMLAKAEAVRRNAKVQFVLTDSEPIVGNVNTITASTSGRSWMVRLYRATGSYVASDFIQGRSIAEGGTGTTVAGGQSNFVFTGTARLSPIPGATVNVNVNATGATRPLRITVSQGSAIRMCDPALSIASSAMGC